MRIRSAGLAATVPAAGALASACGGDEQEAPASRAPALPSAASIEADLYAITCGHVRDQLKWDPLTWRATVAIADRERIPKLARLQATQCLFCTMTVVCEGRPAAFEPADDAVRGVRSGTYRFAR